QVLLERFRVERGDLPGRLPLLAGAALHLVLALVPVRGEVPDVGDVLHAAHVVPVRFQGAAQQAGDEVGAQVADVGVVVDRHAAGVEARLTWPQGLEHAHLAGQRVVQADDVARGAGAPSDRGLDQWRRHVAYILSATGFLVPRG